VWPLAARAQEPAMPVVGFLHSGSPDSARDYTRAFHEGLGESDYIDGRNVAIEYRWAGGQADRLPALAEDLVRRRVNVISAVGSMKSTLAAQAATTTIPIVFWIAADPVAAGLVTSLNRPGGNLTGIASLSRELVPKRLELLHETVPKATTIAVLVNSNVPHGNQSRELEAAAHALGLKLHEIYASTEREVDLVLSTLSSTQVRALMISPDEFFLDRREQLGALTLRHAIPAIHSYREFAAGGGLMSYGGSQKELGRLVGSYTGRILKGEKPGDLPVQQATKFELVINLKTAKALGITVPLALLGRADEVIE